MRGFDRRALAAARERRGWTLGRLAREANVGGSTVSHWEKGIRTPEADNLARVAAALGVPISDLIVPRDGHPTLSDLRVVAGLTQPQLGAVTGLSTTSLSALERGETRLSEEKAARLAEALNTTVGVIRDAYGAARTRGDEEA